MPQAQSHFWLDAKEGLERRHGLVHQHAKPVQAKMTTLACPAKQIGFQWIVDDVTDHGGFGQRRQIEGQRIAPFMPALVALTSSAASLATPPRPIRR